jgi:UDPglucose 6-dehydrogenase
MKIAIVGTGYVGLVAGACFADSGNHVVCVDTDPAKVERLRLGEVPIYEPGLGDILKRTIREGRISFTTRHREAVPGARVAFLAVGTPEKPDGAPDMTQVETAVRDCLAVADGPLILVFKSTVPVGTAAKAKARVQEFTTHPVEIVSNPEFLKEGAAVEDFLRPDRVVIGAESDEAFETMRALYEPFVRSGKPILRMSNAAAELTKYASNAMLAARVSFMNEVARVCDAIGADVEEVRKGMGTDRRIGPSFLYAGCGYGGSCFPKDTQGFAYIAKQAGIDLRIVPAVERVNDEQKRLLADRVKARFGADLRGKRIALWGLAFKPETDDVREAPALVVAEELRKAGATVVGTDPEALETFRAVAGDRIEYAKDPYEAAKGADAVVLCTEWNEYRTVDFERLKQAVRHPVIFDGRNVIDAPKARAQGFELHGIGRGKAPSPESARALPTEGGASRRSAPLASRKAADRRRPDAGAR